VSYTIYRELAESHPIRVAFSILTLRGRYLSEPIILLFFGPNFIPSAPIGNIQLPRNIIKAARMRKGKSRVFTHEIIEDMNVRKYERINGILTGPRNENSQTMQVLR